MFKPFRLQCQGDGFFEAKLIYLFKENKVIQILRMAITLICKMNDKNAQVFNFRTVFFTGNYDQRR